MGKREYFLFEHYRQNLNALLAADPRLTVKPARDDIVVCPLCFNKYFTLDDLQNGDLTGEHIPPEKLGGTIVALTCRDCNNNHGALLDSHLVKYVRNIDALMGTGPTYVDGIASTKDSGEFRIEFRSTGENRWELLGVPQASNVKHIENFTNEFHSDDFSFKLTLRLGNERRAQLSLVRSGYLTAFQYLGYGFLINLGRLRHQFNNPDEDIFPIRSVIFPFEAPSDFVGVNIVSKPPEMKCYLIVFDVQAENGLLRRAGVMLPGPNVEDYAMFMNLEKFSGTSITIKHFDIEFDDKLETPGLAHTLWRVVSHATS